MASAVGSPVRMGDRSAGLDQLFTPVWCLWLLCSRSRGAREWRAVLVGGSLSWLYHLVEIISRGSLLGIPYYVRRMIEAHVFRRRPVGIRQRRGRDRAWAFLVLRRVDCDGRRGSSLIGSRPMRGFGQIRGGPAKVLSWPAPLFRVALRRGRFFLPSPGHRVDHYFPT